MGKDSHSHASLKVLFQDDNLIAVHKPSGYLVHPHERFRSGRTLLHWTRDLLGHYVYAAHRLDRGTSGVVLFAKNTSTARSLGLLFQERQIEKLYLALVRGWPPESGTIERPMDGKPTRSRYVVLDRVSWPAPVGRYETARYSLVAVQPYTGHYHQIRRHLKTLGYPIIGDKKYGDKQHNDFFRHRFGYSRLFLFALCLRFIHPLTKQSLEISSHPESRSIGLFSYLGFDEDMLQVLTRQTINSLLKSDLHKKSLTESDKIE